VRRENKYKSGWRQSLPRRQWLGIFHMQCVTFLSHAIHILEKKISVKEEGASLKRALEAFSPYSAKKLLMYICSTNKGKEVLSTSLSHSN